MTFEEAWEAFNEERKKRALKAAGWRCDGVEWFPPNSPPKSTRKPAEAKIEPLTGKFTSERFTEAWKNYCLYRGNKFLNSARAQKMAINKLERSRVSEQVAIFALEESIANAWSGIYVESAQKKFEEQERMKISQTTLDAPNLVKPPSDFVQWAEERGYKVDSIRELWQQNDVREAYNNK